MEDIDDIEKAPMLGHRSDANGPSRSFVPDEDDPKGFRRTRTRSHESRPFLSRRSSIIYGFFAAILLFAFAVWATDSSRSWRRNPVYWDLDNSKNGTNNSKVLKLEDGTTGNRTRRFRGKILKPSSHCLLLSTYYRFFATKQEIHHGIRNRRLE
jgi:hypothetical protein